MTRTLMMCDLPGCRPGPVCVVVAVPSREATLIVARMAAYFFVAALAVGRLAWLEYTACGTVVIAGIAIAGALGYFGLYLPRLRARIEAGLLAPSPAVAAELAGLERATA